MSLPVLARRTLLLVALLLPSCSDSEQPLADPHQAKADEGLFGLWKRARDGGVELVAIEKPNVPAADTADWPAGAMSCRGMTYKDRELLVDADRLHFFVCPVGEERYFNIAMHDFGERPTRWDASKVKPYYFLKYALAADELTLWSLNNEAAVAAVRAGKLKGAIKKAHGSEWAKLTARTPALVKYLQAHHRDLFPDSGKQVYQRVK